MDRWSRVYVRCQDCGRSSVKHQARGLCQSCYSFTRYHKDKKYRDKHKAMSKDYWERKYEPTKKLIRRKSYIKIGGK